MSSFLSSQTNPKRSRTKNPLLAEASDPTTPLKRLAELAARGGALRRRVAKNPSASKVLLVNLLAFGDPAVVNAFFANPVLDLILLEDPCFFQNLPIRILRMLVESATCPSWLLAQAAQVNHERIQLAICQHPVATIETLQALCSSQWPSVQQAAALHETVAGPINQWEHKLITTVALALTEPQPGWKILSSSAPKEGFPAEKPIKACDEKADLREQRSPLLTDFGTFGEEADLRYAIARVLAEPQILWGWPCFHFMQLAYQRTIVEPCFLDDAFRVFKQLLRYAFSGDCGATLLKRLARHPNPAVRRTIAENPETPKSLVDALGVDECWEVRAAAANNPAALMIETSPGVLKRGVLKRGGSLDPVFIKGHNEDEAYEAYTGIVRSHKVIPDTLIDLALRVANRSRTREKTPRVVRSPTCADGSLEIAAIEQLLVRTASRLANQARPSLARLLMLLSPWVPPMALSQHSNSLWWQERAAVAVHPATPLAIRQYLAQDSNTVVQAAARTAVSA